MCFKFKIYRQKVCLLRTYLTIQYEIVYKTIVQSIAYVLSGIFISALCILEIGCPGSYISYRPPYRTIYITYNICIIKHIRYIIYTHT